MQQGLSERPFCFPRSMFAAASLTEHERVCWLSLQNKKTSHGQHAFSSKMADSVGPDHGILCREIYSLHDLQRRLPSLLSLVLIIQHETGKRCLVHGSRC